VFLWNYNCVLLFGRGLTGPTPGQVSGVGVRGTPPPLCSNSPPPFGTNPRGLHKPQGGGESSPTRDNIIWERNDITLSETEGNVSTDWSLICNLETEKHLALSVRPTQPKCDPANCFCARRPVKILFPLVSQQHLSFCFLQNFRVELAER